MGVNTFDRKQTEVTHLGEVIDCRLTMVKHLEGNITKAKSALGLVRYAAGQNIQLSSLVKLVRATVLSRLEYRLHNCSPISKTQYANMDKILNQALRTISGATAKTSGEVIQFYLGFYSMEQVHVSKMAKEYVKALTTPTHPLQEELVQGKETNERLKIVTPWVQAACKVVQEIASFGSIKKESWVYYNTQVLEVDRMGDRSWRERAPSMNQAEVHVEAYLELSGANIIIGTDGSVREDITAWGGAAWGHNKHVFEWCTGKLGHTSSFRECEAYEDALVWLGKKHHT